MNNCYIYISHESNVDSIATIKVQIDDSVYVNSEIKSTKIFNDFDTYNFKLAKGRHNLIVTSVKDSIVEDREFEIENTIYIVIISTNKKINNYKNNEPIFKDSTSAMLKQLNLDSLTLEKKVSIAITDKFIFDK